MSALQQVITDYKAAMRQTYIVAISNHPSFDCGAGFRSLDQAIAWSQAFMSSTETIGLEEPEEASRHDVALFRQGRLLAVLRHTPDGRIEVTRFAVDPEAN